MRRAGLDYREYAAVTVDESLDALLEATGPGRVFPVSTRGGTRYDTPVYRPGDLFLFGPETRGLPTTVIERFPADQRLRIPMRTDSRSLNLSNSVAVVIFEALRQRGFEGLG